MAVTDSSSEKGQVVHLGAADTPRVSRGFWRDAWRRLRRNKLALLGIIVILVNIFMAIFAPWIAPKTFAEQIRENSNAAPMWVMNAFPTMKALQEDEWTFEGKAGDNVAIAMTSPDFDALVIIKAPDGTILKTGQKRPPALGQPQDFGSYIPKFALSEEGIYTLVAKSTNVGNKGNYLLTVFTGADADQITLAPPPPGSPPSTAEVIEPSLSCTGGEEGLRLCGAVPFGEPVGGHIAGTGYVKVVDVKDYFLGTDALGRDLLSRIIYGSRISLAVAFIGPFVSLIVGLTLGLTSGYAGGQTDTVLMRLVDIMYAFPTILFIILLMAYFRASGQASEPGSLVAQLNEIDSYFGGMLFIFVGIGLTSWMQVTRLTRAQVLSVRSKEYIEAALSIGVPNRSIILRHVLPNILGPIIVAETLTIPAYISYEAFLSFIGLGVNRPTPSWGAMISDGSVAISSYPNQAIFPALALFFIMFAFNFLGDGLRDALDPRSGQ